MALIRCTECGKEISDKATACPHCGCPVQIQSLDYDSKSQPQLQQESNGGRGCSSLPLWRKIIGIIFLVAGLVHTVGIFTDCLFMVHAVFMLICYIGGVWLLKNTLKSVLYTFAIVALLIIVSIPVYTNNSIQEARRKELASRFVSVESITKNIENTIWTYTHSLKSEDDGEYWYRLHFKNGQLYMQQAQPVDGQWGNPKIIEYEVGEHRYADTGELYVSVNWQEGGDHYIFVPENGFLQINMVHYSMRGWDLSTRHYVGTSSVSLILHEEDIDPWDK